MSVTKKWFAAMVITAFLSMISFFQINSYSADKNNLNTFWLIAGIIFALVAVFSLWKVTKNAGGNTGYK